MSQEEKHKYDAKGQIYRCTSEGYEKIKEEPKQTTEDKWAEFTFGMRFRNAKKKPNRVIKKDNIPFYRAIQKKKK